MTTRKRTDYKLTAVNYYLVEDINTKNRLWVNKNDIIKN
jgi:hypothetical protein